MQLELGVNTYKKGPMSVHFEPSARKPFILLAGFNERFANVLRDNLAQNYISGILLDPEKVNYARSELRPDISIVSESYFWDQAKDWVGEEKREPVVVAPDLADKFKSSEAQALAYLEWGADDYIKEDTSFYELGSRLNRILLRRAAVAEPIIKVGDMTIDLSKKTVFDAENEIKFKSGRSWDLFTQLAINAGKVMSHEELRIKVWEDFNFGEDEEDDIPMYIFNLRKKLGEKYASYLQTHSPRAGYILSKDGITNIEHQSQEVVSPAAARLEFGLDDLFFEEESWRRPGAMVFETDPKKWNLIVGILKESGIMVSSSIRKSNLFVASDTKSIDEARRLSADLPILSVAERADVVPLLNYGADQCIEMPFKPINFALTAKYLIKKYEMKQEKEHSFVELSRRLSFDPYSLVIKKDGRIINFSRRESMVAAKLAENFGNVVVAGDFNNSCEMEDAGRESSWLAVVVSRVRKKMGYESIETVKGGYRMVALKEVPVEERATK